MRILAIRGRNIASLAGDFAVDFTREPLASAGLFAICGATGSGKSTLLDVLCVALYDDTPRLHKATGHGTSLPDVQDAVISPNDPRNLLRRGAAEGFAEVDFVGNDGQSYRARWAVRRAHSKVDGKLQAAEMTLRSLPADTPLGGSLKTETQKAIVQRLGLGFDQFVRAVLLAQNEFTAFLHANDNERAELLELLTGTEQFSELSRRAFERCKTEKDELARLERHLGDQRPLDADSRAVVEQDAAAAKADAGRTAAEQQQVDLWLRWHEEHARAAAAEADARARRDLADTSWTEAAARRDMLARVARVQAARPLVADADRTARSLAESRDRLVPEAEREASACAASLRQVEDAAAAAKAVAVAAEDRIRLTTPDLERARTLDVRIEDLNGQVNRTVTETQQAALAAREAAERLAATRATRNATATEREGHAAWLAEHAALRPLAEGWARWDTLLTQAREAHDVAAQHRTDLADAERAAATRHEVAASAARDVSPARAQEQQTAGVLEVAEHALAGFDPRAMAADRDAAQTRIETLRTAQQACDDLIARREAHTFTARVAAEQQVKAEEAERQAHYLDLEQQKAEAAREQAERAHDAAKAAASKKVEDLRAALEADRPCPVCGSLEHPYASADHGVGAVLKALKAELKMATQQAQRLTGELGANRATARQASDRAAELCVELEQHAAALRRAEDTWRALAIATEVSALALNACPGWFARELARADAERQAQAAQEKQWRAATQHRDACRTAHHTAAAALRDAERREGETRAAHTLALAAIAPSRDGMHQAELRRDNLLAQVDGAFPGTDWRIEWLTGPEAFRRAVGALATGHLAHDAGMKDAAARLAQIEASLTGLDEAAQGASARAAQVQAAEATIRATLADILSSRAALLGGRTTNDVSRELARDAETTRAQVGACALVLDQARASSTTAQTRLDDARRALVDRQGAATAASDALGTWLSSFTVDHPGEPRLLADTVRELLAHDDVWLTAERTVLNTLDQERTHAHAIHTERTNLAAAVDARRGTDEDAATLRARHATLTAALDAARDRLITHDAALRQDDTRRRLCEALQADIVRQAGVADVWARMNELIGSADGKRFRNYAQQLTLDVLLGFANVHLTDLSRRYRLRRIDDKLGLAVVDRDMGDDVRSVHSLSGGESFLVSLALALGLASLSANRVRVESLFIDEGFGSLDADTLSVAVDALDRLHAQGRKVGVISHVQELAGRIGTRIVVERQSVGRSRVEVTR